MAESKEVADPLYMYIHYINVSAIICPYAILATTDVLLEVALPASGSSSKGNISSNFLDVPDPVSGHTIPMHQYLLGACTVTKLPITPNPINHITKSYATCRFDFDVESHARVSLDIRPFLQCPSDTVYTRFSIGLYYYQQCHNHKHCPRPRPSLANELCSFSNVVVWVFTP
jgi:hypothetical protein